MRKKRVALIALALAVGLGLAGIGTVARAGEVFREKPDMIEAKLVGENVVMLRNGERIITLTLPEGKEGFSIETSDGGSVIRLRFLTGEERVEMMKKLWIGEELDVGELLEIAEGDGRVQELIAGGEYEVVTAMQLWGLEENAWGVITLEFEETKELYKISIDLRKRTVESIQEVPQPLPVYVRLTVTEAEESAIEKAKEDSRVAELLGVGYEITSAYATILTEQVLTKEGEGYVFRPTIRAVDLGLEKGENRTRVYVEFVPTEIIYPK